MTAEPVTVARPAEVPPVIEAKPAAPSPSNTNVRAEPGSADLAELWSRVMSAVERSPAVAVLAESMRPAERKGSTLQLIAPESSRRLFSDAQREKLEAEVERVFGAPLRVELIADRQARTEPAEPANEREVDASARARAMQHPVVRKATELFDARLIRVEPNE